MSDQTDGATAPATARSFVGHAKLIGAITLVSRVLGMARESVAANYFGAGPVWSAFTVAFTVPNLFRKLFGEGALSAAFIPLYAQAVRREEGSGFRLQGSGERMTESGEASGGASPADPALGTQHSAPYSAAEFAVASVNLLCVILLALTVVGE